MKGFGSLYDNFIYRSWVCGTRHCCSICGFGEYRVGCGTHKRKKLIASKRESAIYEPGLEELVKRNVTAGRLLFTLDYGQAVAPSEIIFICVGTPPKKSGGADLTSVFAAAESVGKALVGYKVVVTKSTVPPGTNKKVSEILERTKSGESSFSIASVPEFLREGTAIRDTLHPDRVVIGTTSKRAEELLLDLHKSIDGKKFSVIWRQLS